MKHVRWIATLLAGIILGAVLVLTFWPRQEIVLKQQEITVNLPAQDMSKPQEPAQQAKPSVDKKIPRFDYHTSEQKADLDVKVTKEELKAYEVWPDANLDEWCKRTGQCVCHTEKFNENQPPPELKIEVPIPAQPRTYAPKQSNDIYHGAGGLILRETYIIEGYGRSGGYTYHYDEDSRLQEKRGVGNDERYESIRYSYTKQGLVAGFIAVLNRSDCWRLTDGGPCLEGIHFRYDRLGRKQLEYDRTDTAVIRKYIYHGTNTVPVRIEMYSDEGHFLGYDCFHYNSENQPTRRAYYFTEYSKSAYYRNCRLEGNSLDECEQNAPKGFELRLIDTELRHYDQHGQRMFSRSIRPQTNGYYRGHTVPRNVLKEEWRTYDDNGRLHKVFEYSDSGSWLEVTTHHYEQ